MEKKRSNKHNICQQDTKERVSNCQCNKILSKVKKTLTQNRKLFDQDSKKDGYVDSGMMDHLCPSCSVKHYYYEMIVSWKDIRFSNCCSSRKIIFCSDRDPTELIKSLRTGQSLLERKFRQNTRKYNNSLAMTSVKVKWDYNARGLSTFHSTITKHGQIFHLIGPRRPLPELPPKFMSIYLYDPDYTEHATLRLRYDSDLKLSILQNLTKIHSIMLL